MLLQTTDESGRSSINTWSTKSAIGVNVTKTTVGHRSPVICCCRRY